MIPKIIHYCWFGKKRKPDLFQKCYASWRKYCKDFKIIEWNEDNFDIGLSPLYVQQAYSESKWAFVTDYVRLKVIYDYGGIYLDTDVELKKKIDKLLIYNAFFGFETPKYINTGIGFGAEARCPLVKEIMDDYNTVSFILKDGSYDLTPCTERNTKFFLKKGLLQNNTLQILEDNILILPSIYLCPIDYSTGHYTKSFKTIAVHWFSESWKTEKQKQQHKIMVKIEKKNKRTEVIHYFTHFPNRILKSILGEEKYNSLKTLLRRY